MASESGTPPVVPDGGPSGPASSEGAAPVRRSFFRRRVLPCLLLFVLLPWLAPRLSKAVMVASDLTALVCAAFWVNMMMGNNTLTNVEALAGLAFLGWFIVFSRQIAAIEADRVAAQLLHAQAIDGGLEEASTEPAQQIESRIAADR